MKSKREQLRAFFKREVQNALAYAVVEMSAREQAEAIRSNRTYIATQVSWHLAEEYRFLELSDIMEWKRTRARR